MRDRPPASPLALAVLSLLEAGPLHPYGVQRLIRRWGKDSAVNVGQRASLYKTIERLQRDGLVTVHQTERGRAFPERTVYALTDEGRRRGREWMIQMLAEPRNEFPRFPAALSFAMLLGPADLQAVLERRSAALTTRLAELDAEPGGEYAHLPRITLIESEYQRTMVAAELAWVDGLAAELRSGALTWSSEQLASVASADVGGVESRS